MSHSRLIFKVLMGVYFFQVCAQKDGFVIREHKLITIGFVQDGVQDGV